MLRRRQTPIALAGAVVLIAAAAPASAQVELSGEWAVRYHEDAVERVAGPGPGDYAGIPINEAGRLRADAWDATLLTLPERLCNPHGTDYLTNFNSHRIWKTIDPQTQSVTSWHTFLMAHWMQDERVIYMDGRPRPSEHDRHTWLGFSTGTWNGHVLTVDTSHMKESWIKRNGINGSDQRTSTEHFIRHGNVLTWISITYDPVYLTEPFIRSRNFVLTPGMPTAPNFCEPFAETERPSGYVPHYLPGTNGGFEWLVGTTIVEDPVYLTQPFITSTNYRKEPDGSKWSPLPCKTLLPPVPR